MTMTAEGSRFVNIGTPWPDRPISERSLRVAMTGYVHDDDPTIIADMQQELDRIPQAIRDALEQAARCAEQHYMLGKNHATPAAIRALKQPETRG